MPLVSVTRLRLRSIRFIVPFIWNVQLSAQQAKNSPGGFGARLRKTRGLTFWTLTLWKDEAAMTAFRMAPPHRRVMPKLAHWCDEASVAHWVQDSTDWPSWEEAGTRLVAVGRLSRVDDPSKSQREGRIEIT